MTRTGARGALVALAAMVVAATAGTHAQAATPSDAAPPVVVLDAVMTPASEPPAPASAPTPPGSTTTVVPAAADPPAAVVVPAAAPAPLDPYGPRCAGCPSVQPDPARPVLTRGGSSVAPILSSVPTTDPVVFLTIDDGEHWNEAAAELLVAARVPFTLFLTQQYVADKVPLMQSLARNGGWVELHTVSHPDLLRRRNDASEICAPLDAYEAAYGRRSTLFRPPYGNANTTTRTVAASCGIEAVVLWRASMNYGALATQGGPLRAGDIVLMHFRPDLADNLTELFRVLDASGLRLGRLECYVGGDPACGAPWR